MKIENAKITKVTLSMADHGCLTFDIFVDGAAGAVLSEDIVLDTDI